MKTFIAENGIKSKSVIFKAEDRLAAEQELLNRGLPEHQITWESGPNTLTLRKNHESPTNQK